MKPLFSPISTWFRRFPVAWMAIGAMMLSLSPVKAEDFTTKAEYAYLIDADTGAVLLEKQANVLMAPASMSKLMTVFMVMEALQEGHLSLDTMFSVSENAWEKGGVKSGSSTMFLRPNTQVRVEDLMRGIIVQSGNDACIVVAENMASTESEFATHMTRRAREIGLTESMFSNATGWPDPNQMMTAHDLAVLARILVNRFPEYYTLFSEKNFTYNNITQGNRNPLLYSFPGADGMKTGHTKESGYGLTATAKIDNRRLVLVVNGLKSMQERADESKRLLEWGFRAFDNYPLFKQGDIIEKAEVWLGDKASVNLLSPTPVTVTLPRSARRDMQVSVIMDQPVPAPIKAGDRIATLKISAPGITPIERPLVAAESVDRLGIVGRIGAAAKYLFWGFAR